MVATRMKLNHKILSTVDEGVAYLRLNKSAKLNALDEDMLLEIDRQFAEWERNPAIIVAVLASTNERAFCVGADIDLLSQFDEQSMRAWELLGSRVLHRMQASPIVSIASIGGYCLGGGLTLASACDFRIASRTAMFAQPEIDLGWIPGWGGVARLARIVGAVRAKQMCITAHHITAPEAEVLGLVDLIVEPTELAKKTDEFAAKLAKRNPSALQAIKALSEQSCSNGSGRFFDAFLNAHLLHDERGQAAIAKFLAKKRG